jgi:hypothetical protein
MSNPKSFVNLGPIFNADIKQLIEYYLKTWLNIWSKVSLKLNLKHFTIKSDYMFVNWRILYLLARNSSSS